MRRGPPLLRSLAVSVSQRSYRRGGSQAASLLPHRHRTVAQLIRQSRTCDALKLGAPIEGSGDPIMLTGKGPSLLLLKAAYSTAGSCQAQVLVAAAYACSQGCEWCKFHEAGGWLAARLTRGSAIASGGSTSYPDGSPSSPSVMISTALLHKAWTPFSLSGYQYSPCMPATWWHLASQTF